MGVHVFSTRAYDRLYLDDPNATAGHDLHYLEPRLTRDTVVLAAAALGAAADLDMRVVHVPPEDRSAVSQRQGRSAAARR